MGAKLFMKIGNTIVPVFTFKPLSRGRFRCNQTGEVVKDCRAYERSHINGGKKFRKRVPKEARDLPQVELSLDDAWKCPNKHLWYNSHISTINFCRKSRVIDTCGCGQKVFVKGRGNFYLL